MLGNFTYHNPTKLIFGKDALASLAAELTPYNTIQLVYGSGSIRRFGIYNQVVETLRAAGKTIVEDSGVMPNPTIEKLREGAQSPATTMSIHPRRGRRLVRGLREGSCGL